MENERFTLYKAVKYQVKEFLNEGGFITLTELWEMVSKNYMELNPTEEFWFHICLKDYNEYLKTRNDLDKYKIQDKIKKNQKKNKKTC